MFYQQKIFLNNKPLVLTNSAEQYMTKRPISAGYLYLKGAFPRNFRLAQKHLEKAFSLGVVIEDISIETLKTELIKIYPEIHAGGGVVSNQDDEILMIFRRGKWDLPKGKLDEGETIEACAVREVKEETGLTKVEIGEKITDTHHIYAREGKQYLKTTHWFQMQADKELPLFPQKEENILEAKWINEKSLGFCLHLSYEAIKEVLASAGKAVKS